jgi:large subunit ribosomal protein L38
VYYGNQIKPFEAKDVPEVSFDHKFSMSKQEIDSKPSFWTLIMTNPDGHFTEENMEYVHWMV